VVRKGVWIGGGLGGAHGDAPPQAFGKLLSEWGVRSEALVQAVGWNWCPLRWVDCKELGDNHGRR
jgi:hypothetical protein